jgi:uncharacterized protein (DUF433 family)
MVLNTPISHITIIDGQAYVANRRVKVKMIVNMIARGHATVEMAMEQYNLSASEVYAALSYYYDNQAAFDAQYEQDQNLLNSVATPADVHINRLRNKKS